MAKTILFYFIVSQNMFKMQIKQDAKHQKTVNLNFFPQIWPFLKTKFLLNQN